eukprot:1359756-Amorphochlora_amoeboformis.AAC.1
MPRSWVPVSRPLPLPLPPPGDNLALNSSRRGNQTLSREEKVGRASIQVMSRDLLRQVGGDQNKVFFEVYMCVRDGNMDVR